MHPAPSTSVAATATANGITPPNAPVPDAPDSDDDIEGVPPVEINLPSIGQLTDERARQIIYQLQSNNSMLRANNSLLRQEMAGLKASLAVGSKKGSKSKGKQADNSERTAPYTREVILLYGKQYSVTRAPWISPRLFGRYPKLDTPDPKSAERYLSDDAFEEGSVTELHTFLGDPELCKLAAELPMFKDEFMTEVNSQRSTGLFDVRSSAAIIFQDVDVPSTIWAASNYLERRNNPVLLALLAPPEGAPSGPQCPFSSILFPGGQYNMALLFFNSYQTDLGERWNATEVNSSMIAFAGILLQFLIASDPEFIPAVDDRAPVPYWTNFKTFRKIIDTNPEWAAGLMAFYNDRVFKAHPKRSGTSTPTQADYTNAVNQAMVDLTSINLTAVNSAIVTATSSSPANVGPCEEAPSTPPSNDEQPPNDVQNVNDQLPAPAPWILRVSHPLYTDGTEILGGTPLIMPAEAPKRARGGGRGRGGRGKGQANNTSQSNTLQLPTAPVQPRRSARRAQN
ncbi:hypothetical protein VNI00_005804 [Paramarasmius palmivorus]|uniref:Uncharacterized protein n=1 Tax=Paramarasmius palmivorus TaxID=297713 RepID=A0AAW0DCZ5_9AGAR